MDASVGIQLLVRGLDSLHALGTTERDAVARLPMHQAEIRGGRDVVREGDRPDQCVVILSGLASSYKLTGDGRRQIVGFHLRGDMPDLGALQAGSLDASVAAVGPCRVGFIAHDAMRKLCEAHPHVTVALWRKTLLQAAVGREWTLNIGRRDARGRLSHLLCEVFFRHQSVGLASRHGCPFPVTQMGLADALGLSTVHVNRVLQLLRAEDLIEWRNGELDVLDWERLKASADFDPAYLSLDRGTPDV